MNPEACWECLCAVDVQPVMDWYERTSRTWPVVAPTKPQRIWELPMELFQPVIDAVLMHLPEPAIAHEPMLSRVVPGPEHPMHTDIRRPDGITRIHVPLVTNPECWLIFEDEGAKIHYEVGWAYTFDTTRRHAFGNDGKTERVHLIFDVLRKDPGPEVIVPMTC